MPRPGYLSKKVETLAEDAVKSVMEQLLLGPCLLSLCMIGGGLHCISSLSYTRRPTIT